MCQGITFNIQKFSIHDGPGIRTTVFFKGCPLRCQWCSNPESQLHQIQIVCSHDNCLKCQTCLRHCPQKAIYFENNRIQFHYDRCNACMECVEMCPVEALSCEGEYKTVEEIVAICKQDIDFYEESGGGVTISGGEGMAQAKFLQQLLTALKAQHIHVAIETTGYVSQELFRQLAPQFDLLLFDVKHYDSCKHHRYTGVHNELIISNLKWAIAQGLNVLPRIPVIPHFNDTLNDAKQLASLLLDVKATRVQLLPFHQFGEKKYALFNKEYSYRDIAMLHPEDLKEYQEVMIKKGLDCFI